MPVTSGTGQNDLITGSGEADQIIGLAGDDSLEGKDGADHIVGDFATGNLLEGIKDAASFAQFGESSAWSVREEADGHTSMSQTVDTVANTNYELTFGLAANYGAGTVSGAVEVLWNGVVIDSFDTNSALFDGHTISFEGTGGPGELTFRSIEPAESDGPVIDTSTPAFHYEKDVVIDGETVTVDAFAAGQSNIYQVLNGTLHVFDTEMKTYEKAGVDGNFNVNAIGFNMEDDLIYGIAVQDGVDSNGNAVSQSDLVMFDATGHSYRIGEAPYRSWTGDFDDKGNLWTFNSSMDWIAVVDVDNLDADGNPVSTVFKLPRELVTDKVWDLAFDAQSQSFIGAAKPSAEGEPGSLLIVDVSGEEPKFSEMEITGTEIDGVLQDGVPFITFGAAIVDGEGNIYLGGNSGDHDMNDSTASSGGIYLVHFDTDGTTATLELVTEAPKAGSNDGAADPRGMDPFTEVDQAATVLIQSPTLQPKAADSESYDDNINGNGGADLIESGYGEDLVVGASLGDALYGGEGNDALYGGAGPDSTSTIQSFYDEDGNRFDQFGNPLPEDDDIIFGGIGDDFMSGSAGHDTLHGGEGADELSGGTGHDVLFGGVGDDTLDGGRENDALRGGDGNDDLNGGSGNDDLRGDAGNDLMNAGSGDDEVFGGSGHDTIDASSGNDRVEGGEGNDKIKAGSGNDVVLGGLGDDTINAYNGDDQVEGGEGRDKIYLGAGDDFALGGLGSDTFVFRSEDLDGGTDVIGDFTRDGSQNDRLDFRALDLLASVSEEEWIAENVTKSAFNVVVDLGGCTIELTDGQSLGDQFYLNVCDGMVF